MEKSLMLTIIAWNDLFWVALGVQNFRFKRFVVPKINYNPGNKLMAKSQKLREISISRYTESVKFKSQSRDTASKRKPYRGLGTR